MSEPRIDLERFWIASSFSEQMRLLYTEPDREAFRAAGFTVTGPHVPASRLQEAGRAALEGYDHLIHQRREYALVCLEQALVLLGVDPALDSLGEAPRQPRREAPCARKDCGASKAAHDIRDGRCPWLLDSTYLPDGEGHQPSGQGSVQASQPGLDGSER